LSIGAGIPLIRGKGSKGKGSEHEGTPMAGRRKSQERGKVSKTHQGGIADGKTADEGLEFKGFTGVALKNHIKRWLPGNNLARFRGEGFEREQIKQINRDVAKRRGFKKEI